MMNYFKKISGYLQYRLDMQNLHTLLTLFSLFVSLICTLAIIKTGIVTGILLIVLFIAIPLLGALITIPQFGIIILIIGGNFVFLARAFGLDFPMGTLLDALQLLLVLNLLIQLKAKSNWKDLKGPVSTLIFVWIGYNIIELVNPAAESRLAWVYTIRNVAMIMLMYFVFLYNINSVKLVRLLIKVWLTFTTLAALYAYKQEYIGFSDHENKYLHSNPIFVQLLFIDGHWRKFSFYSDPVTFAYNMVASSILCICLISGPLKIWKKIILAIMTLVYLQAMLFSGTRGAYVLLPAALVLFSILNFNKKVLFFSIVAAFVIGLLIMMPTSNPSLVRFQSAFKPSQDPSYIVRKVNQKRIQPYILSHPMGGGLGAAGAWGLRFAPYSFLAHFPPDSGYMRIAVELGWIGLILFCTFMFTILKNGINNYYLIKDPELKSYCLAMLLIIFCYDLGNFPQEALVQYPSNLFFYLAMALVNVVYRLDRNKSKTEIKLP